MDDLTRVVLIGAGATALTDLWGLARRPLFGVSAPDYGMVGRWIGLMARGRFRHASISKAPRVPGERALGWVIHYLIGIAYAGLLWLVAGSDWLYNPTPGVALAVGIATVAAPFLLMQPGMGAGIASRLTPNPARARVQGVLMHAVFGLGLYLAALALRAA
jgi:hypothetical protein